MNGSRVKLMQLREYKSDRTGATYFSGFLGNAKVVVLRDDRAELTGRETARWNVLLEEQAPREARQSSGSSPRREDVTAPPAARRKRRDAGDRRAAQFLREEGIDPDAEMPRDEVPF